MFDRRLLTDIGLALLIALPSALPAAPNPWNTTSQNAKPAAESAQASVELRGNADLVQALPLDRDG